MPTKIKAEARHPQRPAPSEAPKDRFLEEARDLRRIATHALDFRPRNYVRSIFGSAFSWLPPHRPTSEFRIVSPWKMRRTVKYLLEVNVPSILRQPQGVQKDTIFLNPTEILYEPDPSGRYDSFPHESWFFINGIATTEAMARMNARCLSRLSHRPITIVHNATDSVGVDLLECAIGKGWEVMSRPARRAYQMIWEALEDPMKERVIVVGHSQGTIVTANVVRALHNSRFKARLFEGVAGDIAQPRELCPAEPHLEHLAKLEIYAFANCADSMRHHPAVAEKGVRLPWLESFGNEYDLVARLGMLAPKKEECGVQIDGHHYIRRGQWGHLLNEHYLFEIDDALRAGRPEDAYTPLGDSPRLPRFYSYFKGQTPDPY